MVLVNKEESTQKDAENSESEWKPTCIHRIDHQKESLQAYKANNLVTSIVEDSKALSYGFVQSTLNSGRHSPVDVDSISKTIHLNDIQPKDDFVGFLSACMKQIDLSDVEKKLPLNDRSASDFEVIRKKCSELPKEWNVIQLSQTYNGYNGYHAKKDHYTNDSPVKITLFQDNMSEKRNHRPIVVHLDLIEHDEKSIFATCYRIHHVLYKNYVASMNTPNYTSYITSLTTEQSKIVSDLSLWLGPWITLFSGKVKDKAGEELEKKIFQDVDEFCTAFFDLSEDHRILLSLIARRYDLLDTDRILVAGREIGRNSKDAARISSFLANLKLKYGSKKFEYYPCILVLDEILDPMPWEMVLTTQEFTRVHSIYLLFDLYERFKDQIVKGYLHKTVNHGLTIINPDGDKKLADMTNRMCGFYEEFFPAWKRIVEEMTEPTELIETWKEADVLVYSGHGSCLQMFESLESLKDHNAVMMLFGCESIAMKARGGICEASCSSYVMFESGCPGMLGALTIVTDIWIDLVTIWLLTQWMMPPGKHPVITVCKDLDSKNKVNKILAKIEGKRNPNLLALLCDFRSDSDFSNRLRSALVYRGLPPYNPTFGK